MLSYPVKLTPDDNDTVLVSAPDFPELTSFGEDEEDALWHAVDALEEAIAARMQTREDVPKPSRCRPRPRSRSCCIRPRANAGAAAWPGHRCTGCPC